MSNWTDSSGLSRRVSCNPSVMTQISHLMKVPRENLPNNIDSILKVHDCKRVVLSSQMKRSLVTNYPVTLDWLFVAQDEEPVFAPAPAGSPESPGCRGAVKLTSVGTLTWYNVFLLADDSLIMLK